MIPDNIRQFYDDLEIKSVDVPYKILVWPNITWSQSLEKDSYIIVIKNIIDNLTKVRSDIHWTLVLPQPIKLFADMSNVVQIFHTFPTYPNEMRLCFDSRKILELINWKENDYDIVYSHLPEHTLQLKNLFYNNTNLTPAFIGYSHWTEFPEVTSYDKTVMDINFLGLAEMLRCGINTKAQKDMVLRHASSKFDCTFLKKLENIVQAQYLGWEEPQFDIVPPLYDKLIVFNHRPHAYKGYDWFIRQMDTLWEKRQDFKVWIPLLEVPDRPYVIVGHNATRREYFSNLKNCRMGVCGEQKYCGWSVSATDGLSVGVPYLFHEADYYRELADKAGTYFTNHQEFLELVESMLEDNSKLHKKMSELSVKRFEESKWDKQIWQFSNTIDEAIKSLSAVKTDSEGYKEILSVIKTAGEITKKDLLKKMNWGVRIKFSPYRNALRNEPNIKFYSDKYVYQS
jgi:glycosyltransferase involved in cell wall biosynthesis